MRKNFFSDRWIFPLIFVFGFFIRLWEIGKRDFWYDEAYTAIVVKEPIQGLLSQLVQDIHPPLYFLFVKGFTLLVGSSVVGIRLISLLFGVFGILAVYLFAKELFNRRVAWFASGLSAVSPFLIGYSQEARMYTMYGFWVVLAAFFFLRSLKHDRWRDALGWGLCLGLAWLTHYMSFLFVFVFFFVHLVWNVRFDALRQIRLIPSKNFCRA